MAKLIPQCPTARVAYLAPPQMRPVAILAAGLVVFVNGLDRGRWIISLKVHLKQLPLINIARLPCNITKLIALNVFSELGFMKFS